MDKDEIVKDIASHSRRPFKKESIPTLKLDLSPLIERSKLAPLDLEIGCGVGLHPIQRAIAHPERILIAVEHTKEKFERFMRRYENHKSPKNLLPLHANAISVVSHHLPDESIDHCFLLYPNPFPKRRDHHRRWPFTPFMQELLKVIKPGGELTFASNFEDYALQTKLILTQWYGMKLLAEEQLTQKSQTNTHGRTHFEQKYLERGQCCFNLRFAKL